VPLAHDNELASSLCGEPYIGNNRFTDTTLEMNDVTNAIGINMTANTNMKHNSFVAVVAEDLASPYTYAKVTANCSGSEFINCKPIYLNTVPNDEILIEGLPINGLLIWGGGGYDDDAISTFIPRIAHPSTTTWGTNMTGAIWYDITYNNMEYWNGTHCIYWNATGTGVQP